MYKLMLEVLKIQERHCIVFEVFKFVAIKFVSYF
jgi:hypothetical protein